MKILTLNSGSSSIKFSLFETSLEAIRDVSDECLARGLIEKIGLPTSTARIKPEGGEEKRRAKEILDHIEAMDVVLELLSESGVLAGGGLDAVGHRVVHGGERFEKSCLVTDEVIEGIKDCIELAPLHNPHNLSGILAASEKLPGVPQVALFDTGFHQTMPGKAYIYAIPYSLYDKHGIRRYGFHGLSHRFVSYRIGRLLGRPREEMKIITAHLGNGASVCAVDHGKSIDTSMGFTPCEGLVMGTRPGDMDPTMILHIMAKEELTIHECDTLLNKHSGLYGLSGISNDLREITKARDDGNERAALAVEAFCHRLKKYISAYAGVLGGPDAIVFTGGIGEKSAEVRSKALSGLEFMGIKLLDSANEAAVGREARISSEDSNVEIWVVPTDEELVIARDTVRVIEGVI